MIPYNQPTLQEDDIKAVTKILKSKIITSGPRLEEFEQKLAKSFGSKYAVACNSGTAALHLAYLAAGLKKGDEVITSPNTFIATTNVMLMMGVKPIFCDINLENYNIDEALIEKLITKKTKAIVAVHFSGHPCAMDKIWKIAKKHKLKVIEDAAHAMGAKHKGKKIGGLKSDFTTASFHPVKSITTGEGGAVFTNDKQACLKMKLFRSHGMSMDKNGLMIMTEFGYNYRINEISCALGISQLKRINEFIKKRNELAKYYNQKLQNIDQIILPEITPDAYSSRHLYVIRTKKTTDKMKLLKYLKRNGISANHHYQAVYQQPYYKKIGFKVKNCPNADLYTKTAISIPIFPSLTKKDQDNIIEKIHSYFNTK